MLPTMSANKHIRSTQLLKTLLPLLNRTQANKLRQSALQSGRTSRILLSTPLLQSTTVMRRITLLSLMSFGTSLACLLVDTSRRDVVCASRALCPHHCWRCILRPFFTCDPCFTFSHVRISLGTPGQRSALVAYDSSLRMFVEGTASSHSHHFWSLEGFSRGRSIPSELAAVSGILNCPVSLFCLEKNIFEGRPSLPGIDGRIATAVPAPFQTTVVQTPLLSWLRLHLSAHPLDMFLLAAISLPRVTSELAATLLCVLQASVEGLVRFRDT